MWNFIKPIKLIRYLVVWRINSALVRAPICLTPELSLGLGSIISQRLPTRRAKPWRKTTANWNDYGGTALVGHRMPRTIPEISWPVESVLLDYSGTSRRIYGNGEKILWELKLMGEDADHGFFLEVILPALEETCNISNHNWRRRKSFWGRFDIQAVYAARGDTWEPVVRDGLLDPHYRANPTQWAEGLTFAADSGRVFDRLTWVAPFDLLEEDDEANKRGGKKRIASHEIPTLPKIMTSLITRMVHLLPGKYNTADDLWEIVGTEEKSAFDAALEQARLIPLHRKEFKRARGGCPGKWTGIQTFASIPHPIIPYLELASILHIGKQTHFGCGTFVIDGT